ncbi:MAG: hypothetical protein AMJ88_14000 [Anaerolineae bacterium SM23_ 63]|nr:MAG: hypothetical protein AMJ88_14000 [Anaerolineae bacterium SM23_ 63]HEY46342.1 hypothetical protein [Anaerolineae bacterium]
MEENKGFRYRSLFWPIVLIGVGVFWLLGNLGILPENYLWTLFRLWPLALIVIGLDIMVGRRSPAIGALIGFGAVALVLVLVFAGSSLGITPPETEFITERFTESIGNATSARVNLNLAVGKTTLDALSDPNTLIDAELTYVGEINFDVQGDVQKTISISHRAPSFSFNWSWITDTDLKRAWWDIGLSPEIPLTLNIDGSVGQSTIDLSGLQIEDLDIDGDIGDFQITLPATEKAYDVYINGGVGAFEVILERGAAVNLTIDGDVGEFVIDVPADAAVRIDADVDIGDVRVPSNFVRLSDGGDFVGESGVWETPDFDKSDVRIVIVFNGGVGDLTVR